MRRVATDRLFTVLIVLLAVARAGADDDSARPNIVFILADDVGQEVLGCYGGLSYATPRIDRLAREGMRLEHAYSMPVCHPSRVCLLTGRYPFRLGSPSWGTFPRSEEKRTVARALRVAGYATAIAGKWQLTLLGEDPEHPHRLGFDEYSLFGWHEGPRYHRPLIRQNGKVRGDVAERYGPDVYCDFLPTFAELAGGAPPEGVTLDGRSFAPALQGRTCEGRRWVFAEHGKESWVRTRRWKLYRDGRLFDLREDPEEARPLPDDITTREATHARAELGAGLAGLLGS